MRTYDEPARSYRGLLVLFAILLALFLVDVALGSAVAHLPGWLIGAALVLGVGALVVHSARVTHSLSLDEDELRIGDEAVARDDIVSISRGVDDELPVLGWRTGLPHGSKGLIVRLLDGQDVVVPCRFPDRLENALGVAVDDGEDVRVAAAEELPLLAEIAERSDTVFSVAGYDLPAIAYDVDAARDALAVFVVGRPPVGFAEVDEVDGEAHLAELAVLPSDMRRGLGGRLVEHTCTWAREHGYRAVTLITYADVAWNGPWYARQGFVETTASTPELARRRVHQTQRGLDAVGRRIVMRREL